MFCTDFILLPWCPQGQRTTSTKVAFIVKKSLFLLWWRYVCVSFSFQMKHQHYCLLTGIVQPESNRVVVVFCFFFCFSTAFVPSQLLKHAALDAWGIYKDPSHFYWGSMFLTLLHSRITKGDFFKMMLHQEKEKTNHRLGDNICKRHIW